MKACSTGSRRRTQTLPAGSEVSRLRRKCSPRAWCFSDLGGLSERTDGHPFVGCVYLTLVLEGDLSLPLLVTRDLQRINLQDLRSL
jgi:hypothetical protein